jgi:hypothetical protein
MEDVAWRMGAGFGGDAGRETIDNISGNTIGLLIIA